MINSYLGYILVNETIQKAVPPQKLLCYLLQGYAVNVYHSPSKTSYMFQVNDQQTDITQKLDEIQQRFVDWSALTISIFGNVPDDLQQIIETTITGSRVGIISFDEEYAEIKFDPATGKCALMYRKLSSKKKNVLD